MDAGVAEADADSHIGLWMSQMSAITITEHARSSRNGDCVKITKRILQASQSPVYRLEISHITWSISR